MVPAPAAAGEVIAAGLTKPDDLGLPFGSWTLDRLATYLNEQKGVAIGRSRIGEMLRAEGLRWRTQETWFGEQVDPEFVQKRGDRRPPTKRRLRIVSSSAWTRWGQKRPRAIPAIGRRPRQRPGADRRLGLRHWHRRLRRLRRHPRAERHPRRVRLDGSAAGRRDRADLFAGALLRPRLRPLPHADTVDPSGPGIQGYNRYAYANNNPATLTDPSGHAVTLVTSLRMIATGGRYAIALRVAWMAVTPVLTGIIVPLLAGLLLVAVVLMAVQILAVTAGWCEAHGVTSCFQEWHAGGEALIDAGTSSVHLASCPNISA